MKTTKKTEEQQLMLAEKQLRKALMKIEEVRKRMIDRIDTTLPCEMLENNLNSKEIDSLWNSADCIGSALCFLHDVED